MERMKLLFLGDSIVDAGRLTEECRDGLGFGFVAELARMLGNRYSLINKGHNGFTVGDVGRSLRRDCLGENPELVTILVGVNNIPMYYYENPEVLPGTFRQEYEEILRRLRQKNPDVQLMLMESFVFREPAEYQTWRPLLQQESQVVRELADQYQAVFVPLQEILDEGAAKYGICEMTTDGIHLTERGNRMAAEQWYQFFQKTE